MNVVHMLGLCAPAGADPFGEALLRALAVPGPTGVRLEVWPAPPELPPHSNVTPHELPPEAEALRRKAADANALVLAVPESTSLPPEPLLTALDWLARPRDGSPMIGKPVAVLTTTSAGAGDPSSPTETERILLGTGCEIVGPRTITPSAGKALQERPGGRVLITDPAAAMRLLLHVRRTSKAARAASHLLPEENFRPWL
ncbi:MULTISPECIES: NAD(P)H-dependent oxidoreductase [Streptomyces]|uniref:NAD(P)H-dependent oxidoreductase n=1 Tax=Streptomyces TaxID=1883 RepID=UPI0029BA70CF|nr:NAD(P)H-dependent oxidoreductase [Streptomyces sp. ID05-18]MDX3484954.1 NAD(P)H-dependent oxidoreductase [Streptomyces sp. ID05-18]